MKQMGGNIKNWRIVEGQVYGDIHGDPRWSDGEAIHSSLITSIIVETNNTFYILDPEEQQDSDLKRFVGREG